METACAAVTIYHRRCSMVPSRNRAVSFFSAIPVFLLVLIAIIFAEILFRTLLHPELHSPDSNHLLIRSIIALVAPLLIITFFLRTRHLATE
jgi:peptidoglycan biosynthesis protein MviN/MurJ (putative lipid II flippase)